MEVGKFVGNTHVKMEVWREQLLIGLVLILGARFEGALLTYKSRLRGCKVLFRVRRYTYSNMLVADIHTDGVKWRSQNACVWMMVDIHDI